MNLFMNKKTQAKKTTGTMKQCNNSSVFVNNQCDSKRLLHSSALTTKLTRNFTIYLNQITAIMEKRYGDSIGCL
jgi:hypothetical protein